MFPIGFKGCEAGLILVDLEAYGPRRLWNHKLRPNQLLHTDTQSIVYIRMSVVSAHCH